MIGADSNDEKASSSLDDADKVVDMLIANASLANTVTKAGWCLRKGLAHVASLHDNSMLPLIQRFGIPTYLSCCNSNATSVDGPLVVRGPYGSFESLCRAVVSQSVSGPCAMAAWSKLLSLTQNNLTPQTILACQHEDKDKLQKAVGITRGKAICLIDLAQQFTNGSLSEEFLTTVGSLPDDAQVNSMDSVDEPIRKALMSVRGIGPWTCDMFLLFHMERSDILPLGDLSIRKGLLKQFGINLSSKPCKGDAQCHLDAYAPYRSLVSYYLWQAVEQPKMSRERLNAKKRKKEPTVTLESTNPSSPAAKRCRQSRRQVTP